MTSNSPSQRFETVALDSDGRAFAAWIDKRNVAAVKSENKPYAGAALAFAWADRTGGTLEPATIARDNTCECRRIAVAFAGPGKPVVLFRNIFDGGIRDHAVITFSGATPGPLYRVSEDDAKIGVCPHQGPSLAIGKDGTTTRRGLLWAVSSRVSTTRAPEMAAKRFLNRCCSVMQGRKPRGFMFLAEGNTVYLAYKSFDGTTTSIDLMTSRDWGKPGASRAPLRRRKTRPIIRC